MDLSRIAIEPRLRDSWEAVDMGISMVRAWWWPLQLSWLVPSSIVFFSSLLVFSNNTIVAFLITWWLNPLWDRFPLILASRALFDEPLNVKAAWSEWLSLFKTDWFAWLTWRRFSPTRSLDMPVTVLERLRGENRTRRLSVLHRTSSGIAFLLTWLCILFEALVLGALWICALLLLPADFLMEEYFNDLSEFFWISQWSVVLWYIALALVSPFYVVGGFALYINRRIELEGWDIEIRFRHILQRFEASQPEKISAKNILPFILPIIFSVGLVFSPNNQAQEFITESVEPTAGTPAERAKQNVLIVLETDDFNRVEKQEGWRFKDSGEKEESEPNNGFLNFLAKIIDALEPIFTVIGKLFSLLPMAIWVILALLIGLAVYHFRDALSSIGRRGEKLPESATPDVMFGLDLRKETLPDDIPAEVMQLWQSKQHREAIGLLYRATLSGLIHKFSYEFYDGYTEQECAYIVSQSNAGTLSTYVQHLTRMWQHIAYAHRLPSDQHVTELCSEWPQHFAGGNDEG